MVPEPFTKIRIKCPPPVPTTVTFSAERTTQHGQRELILNFLSALGAEGLCKEETCRTWEKAAVPSGFPGGASGKESACQFSRCRRCGFDPWNGKIPWRRKWQPPPVFLLRKFLGQRGLVGYSPWVHKRVGHDLATKQQTATYICIYTYIYIYKISTYIIIVLGPET